MTYKFHFMSDKFHLMPEPTDVLFVDAGVKCLIQVKRREDPAFAEGVAGIRNLLGTMILEDALRGIIVSTADHFTYCAYDAVGRANERGMQIDLVDRGKLRCYSSL
jgi:hypothetical protein